MNEVPFCCNASLNRRQFDNVATHGDEWLLNGQRTVNERLIKQTFNKTNIYFYGKSIHRDIIIINQEV